MTKLTAENYYEDTEYFSNSLVSSYMQCPAKQEAIRKGEWDDFHDKDGNPIFYEPFGVGHYFESLLQGDSERVKETDEFKAICLTKTGKPNAKAVMVENMYEMCKDDPIFIKATTGEYEKILTGEIHGYKFKCKVDVLNTDLKFFTDIKSTKAKLVKKFDEDLQSWVSDFNFFDWNDKTRKKESFFDMWNYWLQLAIYQELIKQNYGELFQPFIAGSSKVKPHFYDVFQVPKNEDGSYHERLEFELSELKLKLQLIDNIRNGFEEPKRCNDSKCNYCMSSYKLEAPSLMLPTEELF